MKKKETDLVRRKNALSWIVGILALVVLIPGTATLAQEYANDETPGIDEKLGATVPLDLEFFDEDNQPHKLGDFFTKPTILTLVYLRCPSICSPLMHEVAHAVDQLDLEAGIDFNLVTVSFDKDEELKMVRTAKKNLLDGMEKRIPPESWRFLTGDETNIAKLTDSVGFRFKREKQDFVHAGTVIFLSPEGKIVRYLPGLEILPANMKMAILDAAEGRPRSFMQQLQRLCYSYDTEGRTYVFQVNRIVLMVTLGGLGIFLFFLLVFRRNKKAKEVRAE
ncbi:MAG: SCO family protein [Planctomycetes bacterium]|nr:SCO family protein [Planctomycetota bacterium]